MTTPIARDLAMALFLRRVEARPLPVLSRLGYKNLRNAVGDISDHAIVLGFLNVTSLPRARTMLKVSDAGRLFLTAYNFADMVEVVNSRLSPAEEKARKFTWAMLVFNGSFMHGRNDLEKAWGHEMSIAHLVTCGVAVAPSTKPKAIRSTDEDYGSAEGLEGDISCRCSYRMCVREFSSPRIFLDVADTKAGRL